MEMQQDIVSRMDGREEVKHNNRRENDSGNLSVKFGGTTLSVLNQPTSVGSAVTSTVTAKDTVESEHSSYKEDNNDDDDDDDDDYEEEEEDSDIDVDSGLAASSEMTTANLAPSFLVSLATGNVMSVLCSIKKIFPSVLLVLILILLLPCLNYRQIFLLLQLLLLLLPYLHPLVEDLYYQ